MADNLLTPAWSSASFKWDGQMASHLLRRAGFGGTLEEVSSRVKMGPEKAVASIVNYEIIHDNLPGVEFGDLTAPGMGVGGPAQGGARGGRAGRGAQPTPQQMTQEMMRSLPEKERKALQQIQQAAQ